jgi:hypothetical protein
MVTTVMMKMKYRHWGDGHKINSRRLLQLRLPLTSNCHLQMVLAVVVLVMSRNVVTISSSSSTSSKNNINKKETINTSVLLLLLLLLVVAAVVIHQRGRYIHERTSLKDSRLWLEEVTMKTSLDDNNVAPDVLVVHARWTWCWETSSRPGDDRVGSILNISYGAKVFRCTTKNSVSNGIVC